MMVHAMADLILRPKRQLTLPAEVCEALGLELGDHLELTLVDGGVFLRPKKMIALDALRELQRSFAESGLSEEEIQAEGRRVREQLSRGRYGAD
jgi:AbrB family looped-hinge helix DNA binding protein